MRNTRVVGGAVLAIVAIASVSLAALPPGGTFVDDNGHVFEPAIEAVAAEGITKGCNPPVNDMFCPDDPVTRGQMAAFLVRARGYTDVGDGNLFIDDDNSVFESAIDKLGTAGVTKGCNPPENTQYCPDDNVTRGQMAAFLVRAIGYTDAGDGNLFADDDNSVFENAIDKLGTAGVTKGCNPPENTKFCPDDLVTRGQMAAFLTRALGLDPIVPPPPETTTTTVPGIPGGLIGVIGCSNTEDAVEDPGGYLTQSSKDLLASSASGGGALALWDDNSKGHWDIYDSMRPPGGYSSVWWQLCVRTGEGSGTYEDQMDSVLAQIYQRDPGAVVFVSWLNHYTFVTCPQADWSAEDRLLDYAASLGLATGPFLGPLDESQVVQDDCHPNDAGVNLLGGQLVDFFD